MTVMGANAARAEKPPRPRRGADPARGLPRPLGELVDKIGLAVDALADGTGGAEALHALRNRLSDISVLAEEDPKIERAIERVVEAGDRLAEGSDITPHPNGPAPHAARSAMARKAVAALDGTLVGAKPSRIAVSLDRGW